MLPTLPAPRARLLALPLALALLFPACGGGGSAPPAPPALAADLYVDVLTGSDLNPGTEASPLKTLTAALALAQAGELVAVAPGTYDAAAGEVFPLVVPAGVSVEGDVATRGSGPTPTLATGAGAVSGTFATHACVVLGDGASLRGLRLSAGSTGFAVIDVLIDTVSADVTDCTLAGPCYAGVVAEGPGTQIVERCTVEASAYGVYHPFGGATLEIRDNTFGGGTFGVDVAALSTVTIEGNVFLTSASSGAGVQVQVGNPVIQGNQFAAGTFVTAGIVIFNTSPLVRSNTFLCSKGVRIYGAATPDLGTGASPGLNGFAAVPGAAVEHGGTAVVQAQGNTWQHVPPTAGVDVVVTSTGTVVYGPGMGDKVP